MRVQRGDQNLPVGVGDALVHQIAAGHGGRELVLLRREFPDDLAHVVEVDGVDEVGIGAFEVHHVADHQRLPLLPAERAGGHGPGDLQLVGILGVDLGQLAVADPAVASQRQHPLIGILGIFLQRFVGARDRRTIALQTTIPRLNHFMRFMSRSPFQSCDLILFGRRPARRHQIEASSLYVLVNVDHVFFAEESGPGRHALFFPAGHRDRQKLLLLHLRDGTPQIRPELAARRIGSMAAIAVRVVELIPVEDVLGDLGTLAIDKQREVQLDGGAVLQRVGVGLRWPSDWPRTPFATGSTCAISVRCASVKSG